MPQYRDIMQNVSRGRGAWHTTVFTQNRFIYAPFPQDDSANYKPVSQQWPYDL